jgi:hypothetical protein
MSITVEWANTEKTALHFVFKDNWTWTEFLAVVEQGRVMTESAPHKVDHIYDVRQSHGLPSGAMGQFRSLRNRSPNNLRRRVLVGASSLIMMLSQTMLKIYPSLKENFLVAETLEQAMQIVSD